MGHTADILITTPDAAALDLLAAVNAARSARIPNPELEAKADALYQANHRLAVYGTLGPGKPNHHHIADITGTWTGDSVTGTLVQTGWGAAMGFPALVWSLDGDKVPVQLLTSEILPRNWERLDAFEGKEYCRVLVPLASGGAANIYVSI